MVSDDLVEELIQTYKPLIYSTARRMCPWKPKDEDLLQCGMIGLWRAAEKWDGARPFPPLAKRCIQGEMANHMRKMNRQPPTVPLDGENPALAREDDHFSMELHDAITRSFDPDSREALLLTALGEGDSLKEAARRAGMRPNRARKTAKRAVKFMNF